jgi:hypothetical protein
MPAADITGADASLATADDAAASEIEAEVEVEAEVEAEVDDETPAVADAGPDHADAGAEAPATAEAGTEPAAPDATDLAAAAAAAGGAALADKALKARARIIRVRRSSDMPPPARPTLIDPLAPAAAGAAPDMPAAEGAPTVAPRPVAARPVAARPVAPRSVAPRSAPPSAPPSALAADAHTDGMRDADDDLRRTLAALASETPDDHPRPAPVAAPVEDAAVARLMEQTRSEMAVPENRRRLSAIAHLKAAVAATVAERLKLTRPKAEEAEAKRSEPYRDDLSRAVRPAAPAAGAQPAERPAPLVLVSEQRIDRPAAPAAAPVAAPAPVRPRRVAGGGAALAMAATPDDEPEGEVPNMFSDARGFAEFADDVGAHALPDLIEAAAAYAAAVGGLDQFTRPQLMRQVESAAPEMSREDGLRGFGALLRDGRIVKVQRGKFALSDGSRYLTEARKIAG